MKVIDGHELCRKIADFGLKKKSPELMVISGMIEGIVNELPEVKLESKWISVEERLPEIKKGYEYFGTRCITCDNYKQVIPLRYCRHTVRGKEVCRWTYDDGRLYYGTVVAWMPLPEPPKEGEAE